MVKKKLHVIYSVIGNLPQMYSPVYWQYIKKNDRPYFVPLSSLALFFHLLDNNENVTLKILIPHSLFIKDKGINSFLDLKNFKKLKQNFYRYITNYPLKHFEFLKVSLENSQDIKDLKGITSKFSVFFQFLGLSDKILEDWENLVGSVIHKQDLQYFKELFSEFLKENKISFHIEKVNKEFKQKLNNRLEIEILPSLGIYKIGNISIDYRKITFYDRISYVYLIFITDLLKVIKRNQSLKIYLDVTVGLNSLVIETLEAFYNANVFWNFYFLGKNETNPGEFYLISAEPVIGNRTTDTIKNFSIEKINRIAFFEKPITYQDYKSTLQKELDSDITKAVKQSIYLFNIIKYNLPLAFFIHSLDNFKSKKVQYYSKEKFLQIIEDLLNKTRPKFVVKKQFPNQWIANVEYNLKYFERLREKKVQDIFKNFRNLTFLLILGANLVKKVEKYFENYLFLEKGLLKCNFFNKLPLTGDLKSLFVNLFDDYNLDINISFFNKEWSAKLTLLKKDVVEDNCKYLQEMEHNNNKRSFYPKPLKKRKTSAYSDFKRKNKNFYINKRNFLAHLGLERNITQLCRKGQSFYFAYDEQRLTEIYEFILYDLPEKEK
jgi:hypothetical protein